MTNWKEIHPDFTEELQKEWQKTGFSYEQCKEWVDASLKPKEVGYARWLENDKQIYPEQLLNEKNDEKLRVEYQEWKEWANIHQDFSDYWGNECQDNWKKLGFIPQIVKGWLKVGLSPKDDYELAAYFRSQNYQPEQISIEETKKEFEEWIANSKTAQEYLDTIYPPKNRAEIKGLDLSKRNLEGKLNLNDFKNLERLNCSNNLLTDIDLTSLDPEKMRVIDLSNNNLSERDLTCFSNFVNLERISLDTDKERREKDKYNRFHGSLKSLENLTKLNSIIINNTNIESGLECLPESAENIFANCGSLSSSFVDLGCHKIYEQLKEYFENHWVEYSSSHPAFGAFQALGETGFYTKRINLEAWRIENISTYRSRVKEKLISEKLALQDQLTVLKKQFAREIKGYLKGKLARFETQVSELETNFEQQIKSLKSDWNSQIKKKRGEITNILHSGKGSSAPLNKEIKELQSKLAEYKKLLQHLEKARNILNCVDLDDAKELEEIQNYLTSSRQEIQSNDNRKVWKGFYKTVKAIREKHEEIQQTYGEIEKNRKARLEKHIDFAQKLTQKLLGNQQLEAKIEFPNN